MKKTLLPLIFCVISFTGLTQTFSLFDSDSEGFFGSNVIWCDFDFDGDSDFIINGLTASGTIGISFGGESIIYENTGDCFEVFDTLNIYEKGALQINDFNADNISDVLSTGFTVVSEWVTDRHSEIYLNYSHFDFEIFSSASLPGISHGCATSGDLDNDGDIDIVIFGIDTNNIYGIRTFIKTELGYESYELPFSTDMREVEKIEIFDIDTDGDNDILFCGNNLETSIHGFKIYKNNSTLNFELLESVLNTSFSPSHFSIGDINSDGIMDIVTSRLASCYPDLEPDISAFTNSVNLEFNPIINFSIPPCALGDMAFGDINNDGQSDILISGRAVEFGDYQEDITKIYRNYNGFFQDTYAELTTFTSGSCSFSDFDYDGDLDFLVCGFDVSESDLIRTYIYKNNLYTKGEAKNLQPPTNLTTSFSDDGITFSWSPVLSPTPHTYNLYVGTTPGGTDIMSPSSNIVTGKMHSPKYGNVGFNTSYTIKNLYDGTYYWSVQSVNAAYRSSEFPIEETVLYSGIANNNSKKRILLSENPLTESSYINIPEHTNNSKATLVIYSLDGKLITKKESFGDKINLNKSTFNQGYYFYQLFIEESFYS